MVWRVVFDFHSAHWSAFGRVAFAVTESGLTQAISAVAGDSTVVERRRERVPVSLMVAHREHQARLLAWTAAAKRAQAHRGLL